MRATLLIGITLILAVSFSATGCRKACRNLKVGKVDCDPGFDKMPNVLFQGEEDKTGGFKTGNIYMVNDTSYYDRLFRNERPFGEIDFENRTLMGMDVLTEPGSEYIFTTLVCETDTAIKYFVEYSMHKQCKRNIKKDEIPFTAWVTIPKHDPAKAVYGRRVNVNPF